MDDEKKGQNHRRDVMGDSFSEPLLLRPLSYPYSIGPQQKSRDPTVTRATAFCQDRRRHDGGRSDEGPQPSTTALAHTNTTSSYYNDNDRVDSRDTHQEDFGSRIQAVLCCCLFHRRREEGLRVWPSQSILRSCDKKLRLPPFLSYRIPHF